MYDELVKSLRELCEMTALCDDYSCFECPYEEECGRYKSQRLSAVYRKAADAIEELLKRVRPVVHATWETDTCHFYCSECEHYVDYKTNFCPNCGAKMEES